MPESPSSLSPFQRATMLAGLMGVGRFTCALELQTLATLGHGMDPRSVPLYVKRAMGTHPEIYHSVRAMTGTIRRADLFSFVHDDEAMQEEAEAACWRILPVLLGAAARAYDYGCSVVIFDVERRTLFMKNANNRARTVYARAHEVSPDEVTPTLGPDGLVASITYNGQTYARDRFHIWTWDPEYGELRGQGARDRAWGPYCEDMILSTLENKYLERSVDPTRVVEAPAGPLNPAGTPGEEGEEPVQAIDYVLDLVTGARGGATIGLPSNADENGNKHYKLSHLDLPDRSEVWERAITRRRAAIRSAYLHVAPTAGAEGSPVVDGQHREFVDDIATWVAENVTEILERQHAFNYNPNTVPPPYARTNDVGKANARRTLKELLALANAAPGQELAKRLDVPAALDLLNAPVRDEDDAPDNPAPEGTGRDPGRPRDGIGPRQDRREARKDPEAGEPDGPPKDGTPAKAEIERQLLILHGRTISEIRDRHHEVMAAGLERDRRIADLETMADSEPAPAPTPPVVVNIHNPPPSVPITNNVDARSTVDARTTVEPGAVRVEPGAVVSTVEAPITVSAPVTIEDGAVQVAAPEISVDARTTIADGAVQVDVKGSDKTVLIKRDYKGQITGADVEEKQ